MPHDLREGARVPVAGGFCNPHRLVCDIGHSNLKREFFRRYLSECEIYMVNTTCTAEETRENIRNVLRGVWDIKIDIKGAGSGDSQKETSKNTFGSTKSKFDTVRTSIFGSTKDELDPEFRKTRATVVEKSHEMNVVRWSVIVVVVTSLIMYVVV